MGERQDEGLDVSLVYVPVRELKRLAGLDASSDVRVGTFADACRLNVLFMIATAGSGHIGSSFSSLDIVTWLHLEHLAADDRFFSSKGHDAPGLYSVMIATEKLPEELLGKLRRLDGLPGHPDVGTPGIIANTGSLGMGISKATGMILADRLGGRSSRVVVMTGDGELQEGQIWESLRPAAIRKLRELTVVVDNNRLQSDTYVANVSDLGSLEDRFRAHGWTAVRCNGHLPSSIADAFATPHPDGPLAIIADTIKGRGVSFMEHTAMGPADELYHFHSGAPSVDDYAAGVEELRTRIDETLASLGEGALEIVEVEPQPAATPPAHPQRLINAHARALVDAGARDDRIVVLDADLMLDCGLIPFRDAFPERFIECGIAEQHMVSAAGGLAATGFLPIVHSFACFLSSRPNEQIYNNAIEGRHVVYVGALAGLLPGGPGSSHQAVRDIAALGAQPGFGVVQPATERETQAAFDWAIGSQGPVYIRLVSIPIEVPFEVPDEPLVAGTGRTVRAGSGDVIVLSYGPVMLTEAWHAAAALAADGIDATIVDHPFPTHVDGSYLTSLVNGARLVVTVDDHNIDGALGSTAAAALAGADSPPLLRIGVEGVPVCGTATEVLGHHGLDRSSLALRIREAFETLG